MHEKLSEKHKQTHNVYKVHLGHSQRQLITTFKHQIRSLTHHNSELNQLQRCQTALPPNWEGFTGFIVFGVHTDEIVGVHHRMDEPVQKNGEVNVSIVVYIGIEPIK